jgi:hypothetical protein
MWNEVLTTVRTVKKMSMFVFWVATPCRLAGRCQRFGETTDSIFSGVTNVDKLKKQKKK